MKPPLALAGIVLIAAILMLAGAFSLQVQANNVFAQQTGVPCGGCHVDFIFGYRKLNAFGERFKANGHKLPKLDSQSK